MAKKPAAPLAPPSKLCALPFTENVRAGKGDVGAVPGNTRLPSFEHDGAFGVDLDAVVHADDGHILVGQQLRASVCAWIDSGPFAATASNPPLWVNQVLVLPETLARV